MSGMHRMLALSGLRQTTTFRLTAALGSVFLLAVIVLLGLTYSLTEKEQTDRADQVLYSEAQAVASAAPALRPAAVRAKITTSASGLNFFLLIDPQGRILAGDKRLPAHARAGAPFELAGANGWGVPIRVLVRDLPDGQRLMVARDITPIVDLRHRVLAIMVGSGFLVIASATLAAVLLSLGPLRRVQQLRSAALRIAAGDLSQRMPLSGRQDELEVIAGTVNAMIDEIERLMQQVKGATDAIAHDLRAPLSQLRFQLQGLRDKTPAEQGPVAPIVGNAIEQLDCVLGRFNALLRISELEASGRRAGFGLIDPMVLIANVCELYEPLAEERGISLVFTGGYGHTIEGDETLLLEALSNLVENAIKFIARGGHVVLSLAVQEGDAVIEVRDDGPGIPEGERAMVLQRFRRGTSGRQAPGSGLGLNLVLAIAHLHGFALSLNEANPGLAVRLRAPLEQAPSK